MERIILLPFSASFQLCYATKSLGVHLDLDLCVIHQTYLFPTVPFCFITYTHTCTHKHCLNTHLSTCTISTCVQTLVTTPRYHSGEKKAPVLTIFIGGNHEASNYLQELPYGGWVAPNIYYMGYAGVVRYGGLRIGGLSGIYKGPDYLKGRYEKTPYSDDSIRSVYHVRNLEVFRLKQVRSMLPREGSLVLCFRVAFVSVVSPVIIIIIIIILFLSLALKDVA